MSYLVLARKYRPNVFDDVIGQDHITDLLKKAITADRVAHAYLFCGPRGVGKTSCARILARSLNCEKGPTTTPCGKCSACKEIAQGNSFDVLEIDGASNRGIDEIRTLRDNVRFAPSAGKYKLYIVDEVHMLTMEAFNALLKTLEEPPPHVKFIFATTDPNKVPVTIISRCQRYDFKRLALKTLAESLASIGKKEGFDVEQEALYAIAKAAQGSVRDALSILDQVSALSERAIRGEDVYAMLGLVELELLFSLSTAISRKDCAQTLQVFDDIIERGKDLKQLARDLIDHFRNLMIIKIGGKSLGRLVDYPVEVKEQYLRHADDFALTDILQAIDGLIESQDIARVTETMRTPLEIAFAKLTYAGHDAASSAVPPKAPVKASAKSAAMATPKSAPPPKPRSQPAAALKNQRGEAAVAPTATSIPNESLEEDDVEALPVTDLADAASDLDMDKIKRSWSALTHAVSREKMSLATFLQEGNPVELNGNRLRIVFSRDHEFHKESP